jgi:ketosteroid isomerase-like protein
MAQDNRSDLARLERMEQRLQALEDSEAIRNLKARYAALCDNQYDCDGIAALFTEDAVWESPTLGQFEGREAIRGFFREASGIFSFAIHYSLNGHIEVKARRRERGGTCSCRARWPPEIRRCGAPASITRLTRGWMGHGCSATSDLSP